MLCPDLPEWSTNSCQRTLGRMALQGHIFGNISLLQPTTSDNFRRAKQEGDIAPSPLPQESRQ
jgi:hypothetical protein